MDELPKGIKVRSEDCECTVDVCHPGWLRIAVLVLISTYTAVFWGCALTTLWSDRNPVSLHEIMWAATFLYFPLLLRLSTSS